MKKNITLLLMITFINISCKQMKAIKNQEIRNKIGAYAFNKESNLIYFETLLENNKVNFMFDTGATSSVITDSTTISNFSTRTFNGIGSLKGADRKKTKRKILVSSIESPLFYSQNKVFSYLNMISTNKCAKKNEFQGILGVDIMFNDDLLLLMDFTNSKISYITDSDKKKIALNEGYQKIKSECKMNQIFIFLNINNNEYRFKLDTGFLGNIVIPYNENLKFEKDRNIAFEGEFFQTASGRTNGEEIFYENQQINLGDINVNSTLLISKSIKAQNVGINFIKGFDWIIDFYNNEVYIKKNNIEIESDLNNKMFQYRASERNNKIVVTIKQKKLNEYQLNDEIISVNDKTITSENICETVILLNNTANWDELKIKKR
jgi:predicted aspartyl protease